MTQEELLAIVGPVSAAIQVSNDEILNSIRLGFLKKLDALRYDVEELKSNNIQLQIAIFNLQEGRKEMPSPEPVADVSKKCTHPQGMWAYKGFRRCPICFLTEKVVKPPGFVRRFFRWLKFWNRKGS